MSFQPTFNISLDFFLFPFLFNLFSIQSHHMAIEYGLFRFFLLSRLHIPMCEFGKWTAHAICYSTTAHTIQMRKNLYNSIIHNATCMWMVFITFTWPHRNFLLVESIRIIRLFNVWHTNTYWRLAMVNVHILSYVVCNRLSPHKCRRFWFAAVNAMLIRTKSYKSEPIPINHK